MWVLLLLLLVTCAAEPVEDNIGDQGTSSLDVTNNKEKISVADKSAPSDNQSQSEDKVDKQEAPKWLTAVTAGPTILVFIICVIFIAFKNYLNENSTVATEAAQDSATDLYPLPEISIEINEPPADPKIKKKKHVNEEVYNEMLERFKADKTRKTSFTAGRKSSQIKLEGVVSHSPRNIARKHIILGRLNDTIDIDDNHDSMQKQVEGRSNTHVERPMFRMLSPNDSVDQDASNHILNLIEKSRDDITSCMRILPDDVKVLLPEDLNEAFLNFASWQESLI